MSSYVPNLYIMYYKIFGPYLDKIIRFYQWDHVPSLYMQVLK